MFKVILRYIRTYAKELFFALAALVGCFIAIRAWGQDIVLSSSIASDNAPIVQPTPQTEEREIIVDVSGAVKKPGIYILDTTARVADAVASAGGLSKDADTDYYYRNYNIARVVNDEEKIYIPTQLEVEQGVFIEGVYTIEHSLSRNAVELAPDESTHEAKSSGKVAINSASSSELEELPGIGPVTAQKIIDGRPYSSIDELKSNKVVGESVFDNISELIEL